MSEASQLDLFEDPKSSEELLKCEISELKKQLERSQRNFSKRLNELAKLYLVVKEENEQIQSRLAKLEKHLMPSDLHESSLVNQLYEEAYAPLFALSRKG